MKTIRTKVVQKSTGRAGTKVARHTDYAEPMNEVLMDDGYTAMLKDSEIERADAGRTWLSVDALEICPGDLLIDGYAARIELGQLDLGAKYADVTLDTGEIRRCWEGFLYRVAR